MQLSIRSHPRVRWLAYFTIALLLGQPFAGAVSRASPSLSLCVTPHGVENPTDPGHDAFIASKATDIFVGRVLSVDGPRRDAQVQSDGIGIHFPDNTLEIEVLETVKGELTGTVLVDAPIRIYDICIAPLFDPPFHTPALAHDDVALFFTSIDIQGRLSLIVLDDGYFRIDHDEERIELVERFQAIAQATPIAAPEGENPVASPNPTVASRWGYAGNGCDDYSRT